MLLSQKNKRYYLKKLNIIFIQKTTEFSKKKKELLTEILVSLKSVLISDEDLLLKNNLFFLERITGQKANAVGQFKYIGSTKKFFFEGSISLRKKRLIDFFFFLTICCLAVYVKRNGLFSELLKVKMYKLWIIDFNIFPNFNFLNITGNLVINFIGNSENSEKTLDDLLQLIKIK